MPKRNRIQQKASLREFLHTGTLGPLNLDLTMLEVSALLGPPSDWITDATDCAVPIYWMYNYLEIQFQQEPPYVIDWFQIEHPDALRRPHHNLADLLVLSMDRINPSAPPSRMLRQFQDVSNIVVGTPKNIDDTTVEVSLGNVCMIYAVVDHDLERFPDKERDPHGWLRHFDRHCFIDGIYALRQPTIELQFAHREFRNMSAKDYLSITGAGR